MERGNCSFTTKALNSQKEYARMAIVFDNLEEDTPEITMADDGRGYLV